MESANWVAKMVDCLASEEADSARMTEAINLKYEYRPKSVFKYRAVDDDGYSLQNLERDCVWVCSPTAYNDPFDSSLSIAMNVLLRGVIREGVKNIVESELTDQIDPEKLSQLLESANPGLALQELFMLRDGLSKEEQAHFRQWLAAQMDKWERLATSKLPESHKESLKICSFSEKPDSITMWSHYADQHRGFCIEYGVQDLPPSDGFVRMLFPVVYSERLFDATRYFQAAIRDRDKFNMLFPILAALHKSPEWSYEKEWRLIIPANLARQAGALRVPKPKAVNLGPRMLEAKRAAVIEICRRKGIPIYQMSLARDSFCLRSEPLAKEDQERANSASD
ncbi:Protein of unknown function [Bryocella elongata]|uniref:DUF2971 domain-containing protein n=1 Tax=Bryocella elongata TaxID=863522 RepID=A0A1H6B103_9BACT|nr:DUF2971 domain-containing protein [Bryocella elongata]SEG53995.1 Protein of unknown function [Bryocella elongata]